ncbi:hypothetical protein LTR85_004927 [Meristemomyces frigidus]|nr:hypothetical protein LTR85_004927 [Meristemomyces frigidus]
MAKQERRVAMKCAQVPNAVLRLAGRLLELAAGTPSCHSGTGRIVPSWKPDAQRLGGDEWYAQCMGFCTVALLLMAKVLSARCGNVAGEVAGRDAPGTGVAHT